ncbi:sulfite oxidase [Rugosimonospora africana]|uniref:Oxidoreductase n=1 Tax=Rugosimonospora africana TaxID=556532 RepID=A0A8J3VN87_9ACTN|nr:sulfite oxidase [Rugosimonospora africana]GIH12161.1 oxidoreductase [Rugosimonospora africana]
MKDARVPRWFGSLAGLASAAVALGVAEVVAVFAGARSAPLVAVGGVVVDSVPKPVKNFAVATFGTHDKAALLIGTTVLLALFAALIGALAVGDLRLGLAGIGVFGIIGIAAAVTRPNSGPGYVFPSLLGAVAGGGAMILLLRQREISPDPYDRRRFLMESGGVLAGAAVVGFIGRQIANRQNVSKARAAVTLPTPASPAPAVPAGANVDTPGASSFVTSNDDFYRIDTALSVPQVDPATWTLRIHGRVRKPMTLTFADLLARPAIERYVTLTCVSNEVGGDLVGNALWLGVPLKDLLEEAGPMDGADQVVGRAVDGFTVGSPTAVLMDGRDAMLAFGMNGKPLPIEHGFPVRVVVPGLYGYVSATKWLSELELTSFADYSAYWVPRGWSQQAPIKTESRIDTPRDGSAPRRGQLTVAGVAWAQHRGISRVEVRIDNGAWQQATLGEVPSVDTWRMWSWTWDATPGDHRIQVRATDNAGATQTQDSAPPDPDGATGWHTISVSVN